MKGKIAVILWLVWGERYVFSEIHLSVGGGGTIEIYIKEINL